MFRVDPRVTFVAVVLGLPDPAAPLAEILSAQPERAGAQALLEGARNRVLSGRESVLDAATAVRTAWSAPEPSDALARLADAAAELGAIVRSDGAALDDAIAAVAGCRADALRALAATNHAAAGWPEPPVVQPEMAATLPAAGMVVQELLRRLDAARDGIRAALQHLLAAFGGDLRDVVPTLRAPGTGPDAGWLPGPPPRPTLARTTDLQLREQLAADLATDDPDRLRFAQGVKEAIDTAGSHQVQLLIYEPGDGSAQGRAALSVGDLATADNLAVIVPGVGNSPVAMAGTVTLAADLVVEAGHQEPDRSHVAVVWFGYDIPLSWIADGSNDPVTIVGDTIAATNAHSADHGGGSLARDTRRFLQMTPPGTLVTMIGHSMGSVTVASSGRYDYGADNIVLLGSPGAGWRVDDAAAFAGIDPGNVFVVSHDADPVTRTRTDLLAATFMPIWSLAGPRVTPFGPDPASAEFGAQLIDAPSTVPRLTIPTLPLITDVTDGLQHPLTNYLGGASLIAVGSVMVGRYGAVRTRRGR